MRKPPVKSAKATTSKSKGVTPAELKKIALSFPDTAEGTSYTHPAILASGKFFTRYRKEDNSFVLAVGGMEYRDMLLEMDPKTYFITDHYKSFPGVLVRLQHVTKDEVCAMLDRRWRQIAPKKLVRERKEKQNLSSPASAPRARWSSSASVGTTQVAKVRKQKNRFVMARLVRAIHLSSKKEIGSPA